MSSYVDAVMRRYREEDGSASVSDARSAASNGLSMFQSVEEQVDLDQADPQQGGGGMGMPNLSTINALKGAKPTSTGGDVGPGYTSAPTIPNAASVDLGGWSDAPGPSSQGASMTNGTEGSGASGGGSYGGAALGAVSGFMAGRDNYKKDPMMSSGEDGYGEHHKDYRAHVGGGILGGVMGYFGGPVGGALAGPVVKTIHPFMEKHTRATINEADDIGGVGVAEKVDPIGTWASGKYSNEEILKGAVLGPAERYISGGGIKRFFKKIW